MNKLVVLLIAVVLLLSGCVSNRDNNAGDNNTSGNEDNGADQDVVESGMGTNPSSEDNIKSLTSENLILGK